MYCISLGGQLFAHQAWILSAQALGGSPTEAFWNRQKEGVTYEMSLVAIDEGMVVGTVFTREPKISGPGHPLRIATQSGFAVHPDYRGAGLGLRLLKEANQRYDHQEIDLVIGWPEYPALDVKGGFQPLSHFAQVSAQSPLHLAARTSSSLEIRHFSPGEETTTALLLADGVHEWSNQRDAGHEMRTFANFNPAKNKRYFQIRGPKNGYAILSSDNGVTFTIEEILGPESAARVELLAFAFERFPVHRIKHLPATDAALVAQSNRQAEVQSRALYGQAFTNAGQAHLDGDLQSEYF